MSNIKSWSEITRIVKVLNGEIEANTTDEFKSGDIAKAEIGTKTAIVRVSKALQSIKSLAQSSREEVQELKDL